VCVCVCVCVCVMCVCSGRSAGNLLMGLSQHSGVLMMDERLSV